MNAHGHSETEEENKWIPWMIEKGMKTPQTLSEAVNRRAIFFWPLS